MAKSGFQKRVEDFVCEKCGKKVKGTGYTDHCPDCLWSKHTDIAPGDRKADCRGLMEPVGAQTKGAGYLIYYQCQQCGYQHRVKSSPNDNFGEILKLVQKPLE